MRLNFLSRKVAGRALSKIVAGGVIVCFIFSNLAMPPQAYAAEGGLPQAAGLPSLVFSQLQIPAEIGEVQEIHQGINSQRIILIQDAHAVIDAQKNIERLLRYFQSNFDIGAIGLEGGSGPLDTTLFRAFPDPTRLAKVLEKYLNDAVLTGGEIASVMGLRGDPFYGIETMAAYEANLQAYRSAIKVKDSVLDEIAVSRKELDHERVRIYSPELNALHNAVQVFRRQPEQLIELLKVLMALAEKPLWIEQSTDSDTSFKAEQALGVAQRFPRLAALMDSVHFEESLDRERVENSVRRIADSFKKDYADRLGHEALLYFNAAYQSFVTGKETVGSFLKALIEISATLDSPIKLSPELAAQVENTKNLSVMKGMVVFDELEDLIRETEARLAVSPQQERLLLAYRQIQRTEDLASLELSNQEWRAVRDDLPAHQAFMQKPELLSAAVEFYRLASARDAEFHHNIKRLMAQRKTQSAILVLGGFHTQGVKEALIKAGDSVVVITPRMASRAGQEKYQKVMEGGFSFEGSGSKNLYEDFIENASQQLLGAKKADEADSRGPSTHPRELLKDWRDNTIRFLAEKNRLSASPRYLAFIDSQITQQGDQTGSRVKAKTDLANLIDTQINVLTKKAMDQVWEKFQTELNGVKETLRDRLSLQIQRSSSAGQFMLGKPLVLIPEQRFNQGQHPIGFSRSEVRFPKNNPRGDPLNPKKSAPKKVKVEWPSASVYFSEAFASLDLQSLGKLYAGLKSDVFRDILSFEFAFNRHFREGEDNMTSKLPWLRPHEVRDVLDIPLVAATNHIRTLEKILQKSGILELPLTEKLKKSERVQREAARLIDQISSVEIEEMKDFLDALALPYRMELEAAEDSGDSKRPVTPYQRRNRRIQKQLEEQDWQLALRFNRLVEIAEHLASGRLEANRQKAAMTTVTPITLSDDDARFLLLLDEESGEWEARVLEMARLSERYLLDAEGELAALHGDSDVSDFLSDFFLKFNELYWQNKLYPKVFNRLGIKYLSTNGFIKKKVQSSRGPQEPKKGNVDLGSDEAEREALSAVAGKAFEVLDQVFTELKIVLKNERPELFQEIPGYGKPVDLPLEHSRQELFKMVRGSLSERLREKKLVRLLDVSTDLGETSFQLAAFDNKIQVVSIESNPFFAAISRLVSQGWVDQASALEMLEDAYRRLPFPPITVTRISEGDGDQPSEEEALKTSFLRILLVLKKIREVIVQLGLSERVLTVLGNPFSHPFSNLSQFDGVFLDFPYQSERDSTVLRHKIIRKISAELAEETLVFLPLDHPGGVALARLTSEADVLNLVVKRTEELLTFFRKPTPTAVRDIAKDDSIRSEMRAQPTDSEEGKSRSLSAEGVSRVLEFQAGVQSLTQTIVQSAKKKDRVGVWKGMEELIQRYMTREILEDEELEFIVGQEVEQMIFSGGKSTQALIQQVVTEKVADLDEPEAQIFMVSLLLASLNQSRYVKAFADKLWNGQFAETKLGKNKAAIRLGKQEIRQMNRMEASRQIVLNLFKLMFGVVGMAAYAIILILPFTDLGVFESAQYYALILFALLSFGAVIVLHAIGQGRFSFSLRSFFIGVSVMGLTAALLGRKTADYAKQRNFDRVYNALVQFGYDRAVGNTPDLTFFTQAANRSEMLRTLQEIMNAPDTEFFIVSLAIRVLLEMKAYDEVLAAVQSESKKMTEALGLLYPVPAQLMAFKINLLRDVSRTSPWHNFAAQLLRETAESDYRDGGRLHHSLRQRVEERILEEPDQGVREEMAQLLAGQGYWVGQNRRVTVAPAAEELAANVKLEASGYRDVAEQGDVKAMMTFVRRAALEALQLEVTDEIALQAFAAWYTRNVSAVNHPVMGIKLQSYARMLEELKQAEGKWLKPASRSEMRQRRAGRGSPQSGDHLTRPVTVYAGHEAVQRLARSTHKRNRSEVRSPVRQVQPGDRRIHVGIGNGRVVLTQRGDELTVEIPAEGKSLTFKGGQVSRVTIGRGAGNTVALEDATASRSHLLMTYDSKQTTWVLQDQSTHGTFMNDQRIEKNSPYPLTELSMDALDIPQIDSVFASGHLENLPKTFTLLGDDKRSYTFNIEYQKAQSYDGRPLYHLRISSPNEADKTKVSFTYTLGDAAQYAADDIRRSYPDSLSMPTNVMGALAGQGLYRRIVGHLAREVYEIDNDNIGSKSDLKDSSDAKGIDAHSQLFVNFQIAAARALQDSREGGFLHIIQNEIQLKSIRVRPEIFGAFRLLGALERIARNYKKEQERQILFSETTEGNGEIILKEIQAVLEQRRDDPLLFASSYYSGDPAVLQMIWKKQIARNHYLLTQHAEALRKITPQRSEVRTDDRLLALRWTRALEAAERISAESSNYVLVVYEREYANLRKLGREMKEHRNSTNAVIRQMTNLMNRKRLRIQRRLSLRIKSKQHEINALKELNDAYEAQSGEMIQWMEQRLESYRRGLGREDLVLGISLGDVQGMGQVTLGLAMGMDRTMQHAQTQELQLLSLLQYDHLIQVDESLVLQYGSQFKLGLNRLLPHELGHVLLAENSALISPVQNLEASRFLSLGSERDLVQMATEVQIDKVADELVRQMDRLEDGGTKTVESSYDRQGLALKAILEIFTNYSKTERGQKALKSNLVLNLARFEGQVRSFALKTPQGLGLQTLVEQLQDYAHELIQQQVESGDRQEAYTALVDTYRRIYEETKVFLPIIDNESETLKREDRARSETRTVKVPEISSQELSRWSEDSYEEARRIGWILLRDDSLRHALLRQFSNELKLSKLELFMREQKLLKGDGFGQQTFKSRWKFAAMLRALHSAFIAEIKAYPEHVQEQAHVPTVSVSLPSGQRAVIHGTTHGRGYPLFGGDVAALVGDIEQSAAPLLLEEHFHDYYQLSYGREMSAREKVLPLFEGDQPSYQGASWMDRFFDWIESLLYRLPWKRPEGLYLATLYWWKLNILLGQIKDIHKLDFFDLLTQRNIVAPLQYDYDVLVSIAKQIWPDNRENMARTMLPADHYDYYDYIYGGIPAKPEDVFPSERANLLGFYRSFIFARELYETLQQDADLPEAHLLLGLGHLLEVQRILEDHRDDFDHIMPQVRSEVRAVSPARDIRDGVNGKKGVLEQIQQDLPLDHKQKVWLEKLFTELHDKRRLGFNDGNYDLLVKPKSLWMLRLVSRKPGLFSAMFGNAPDFNRRTHEITLHINFSTFETMQLDAERLLKKLVKQLPGELDRERPHRGEIQAYREKVKTAAHRARASFQPPVIFEPRDPDARSEMRRPDFETPGKYFDSPERQKTVSMSDGRTLHLGIRTGQLSDLGKEEYFLMFYEADSKGFLSPIFLGTDPAIARQVLAQVSRSDLEGDYTRKLFDLVQGFLPDHPRATESVADREIVTPERIAEPVRSEVRTTVGASEELRQLLDRNLWLLHEDKDVLSSLDDMSQKIELLGKVINRSMSEGKHYDMRKNHASDEPSLYRLASQLGLTLDLDLAIRPQKQWPSLHAQLERLKKGLPLAQALTQAGYLPYVIYEERDIGDERLLSSGLRMLVTRLVIEESEKLGLDLESSELSEFVASLADGLLKSAGAGALGLKVMDDEKGSPVLEIKLTYPGEILNHRDPARAMMKGLDDLDAEIWVDSAEASWHKPKGASEFTLLTTEPAAISAGIQIRLQKHFRLSKERRNLEKLQGLYLAAVNYMHDKEHVIRAVRAFVDDVMGDLSPESPTWKTLESLRTLTGQRFLAVQSDYRTIESDYAAAHHQSIHFENELEIDRGTVDQAHAVIHAAHRMSQEIQKSIDVIRGEFERVVASITLKGILADINVASLSRGADAQQGAGSVMKQFELMRETMGLVVQAAKIAELMFGDESERKKIATEEVDIALTAKMARKKWEVDIAAAEAVRHATVQHRGGEPRSIKLSLADLRERSKREEPLIASIVPHLFSEDVGNLLRNSVLHGKRTTQIKILMAGDDTTSRLIVQDNGNGIRPDLLERGGSFFMRTPFNPTKLEGGFTEFEVQVLYAQGLRDWVVPPRQKLFERGVSAQDNPFDTGIGLAEVWDTITSWGGTIEARNQVNADGIVLGAEFVIDLPRLFPSEPDALRSEVRNVDRELALVELGSRWQRTRGYEEFTALYPQTALQVPIQGATAYDQLKQVYFEFKNLQFLIQFWLQNHASGSVPDKDANVSQTIEYSRNLISNILSGDAKLNENQLTRPGKVLWHQFQGEFESLIQRYELFQQAESFNRLWSSWPLRIDIPYFTAAFDALTISRPDENSLMIPLTAGNIKKLQELFHNLEALSLERESKSTWHRRYQFIWAAGVFTGLSLFIGLALPPGVSANAWVQGVFRAQQYLSEHWPKLFVLIVAYVMVVPFVLLDPSRISKAFSITARERVEEFYEWFFRQDVQRVLSRYEKLRPQEFLPEGYSFSVTLSSAQNQLQIEIKTPFESNPIVVSTQTDDDLELLTHLILRFEDLQMKQTKRFFKGVSRKPFARLLRRYLSQYQPQSVSRPALSQNPFQVSEVSAPQDLRRRARSEVRRTNRVDVRRPKTEANSFPTQGGRTQALPEEKPAAGHLAWQDHPLAYLLGIEVSGYEQWFERQVMELAESLRSGKSVEDVLDPWGQRVTATAVRRMEGLRLESERTALEDKQRLKDYLNDQAYPNLEALVDALNSVEFKEAIKRVTRHFYVEEQALIETERILAAMRNHFKAEWMDTRDFMEALQLAEGITDGDIEAFTDQVVSDLSRFFEDQKEPRADFAIRVSSENIDSLRGLVERMKARINFLFVLGEAPKIADFDFSRAVPRKATDPTLLKVTQEIKTLSEHVGLLSTEGAFEALEALQLANAYVPLKKLPKKLHGPVLLATGAVVIALSLLDQPEDLLKNPEALRRFLQDHFPVLVESFIVSNGTALPNYAAMFTAMKTVTASA